MCRNQSENKGKPCFNCGKTGHFRRNCPKLTCFNCGKSGHMKPDCPQLNAAGKRGERAPRQDLNGQGSKK